MLEARGNKLFFGAKAKIFVFKVAPYGSAYFWTFQRYDYVNEYIIFFSSRHDNRTTLEYLEAILDNVSVTIAT